MVLESGLSSMDGVETAKSPPAFIEQKQAMEVNMVVDDAVMISTRIKDKCNQLISLNQPNTPPQQQVAPLNPTVTAFIDSMGIDFINIRKSIRDTLIDSESKKLKTNEEKEKLEKLNLVYQNYLYEKNHLNKEINSFKDFNIENQKPNLLPLEHFESKLKDITSTTTSTTLNLKPTDTNDIELDQHNLLLNRLNFELFERNRMIDQLIKIQRDKKLHLGLNTTKQEFLSSLLSNLSTLSKKTSILSTTSYEKRDKLFNLPKPLYVLYYSIDSYLQSNSKLKLSIRISGNTNDAIKFNREYIEIQQQLTTLSSTSSLQQQQQQQDNEQLQQQFLKNNNSSEIHPFSVGFDYSIGETKVSLEFYWDWDRNIVLCKPVGHSDFYLYNIFPNDTGLIYNFQDIDGSPQSANSQFTSPQTPLSPNQNQNNNINQNNMLPPQQSTTTTASNYGKPYKWAQVLCGLLSCKFIQSDSNSTTMNQWSITSNIMNSILKRLECKVSFEKQISTLKRQAHSTSSSTSRDGIITSPSPFSSPKSSSNNIREVNNNSIGSSSSNNTIKFISTLLEYDSPTPTICGSDLVKLFFKNNLVDVEVLIIIPSDYPLIPPLFQIVTAKAKENTEKDVNHILLLQKEQINSLESYLNFKFLVQNPHLQSSNEMFGHLIQRLKDILVFLSSDTKVINSKCQGRLTKGKLRTLPFSIDSQTLLWKH